jgi:hypothetical protein
MFDNIIDEIERDLVDSSQGAKSQEAGSGLMKRGNSGASLLHTLQRTGTVGKLIIRP